MKFSYKKTYFIFLIPKWGHIVLINFLFEIFVWKLSQIINLNLFAEVFGKMLADVEHFGASKWLIVVGLASIGVITISVISFCLMYHDGNHNGLYRFFVSHIVFTYIVLVNFVIWYFEISLNLISVLAIYLNSILNLLLKQYFDIFLFTDI